MSNCENHIKTKAAITLFKNILDEPLHFHLDFYQVILFVLFIDLNIEQGHGMIYLYENMSVSHLKYFPDLMYLFSQTTENYNGTEKIQS